MSPHPEGGWYRRLWAASERIQTARGPRHAATAIHYLLFPGEVSAWHRVDSDELWLWQGGGTLRLSHAPEADGAAAQNVTLGGGADPESLWAVVPAGRWQTARGAGPEPALCVCVVAPGFDWADFHLRDGH
ncbi:cupin domain-containing protein [Streptomyces sp. NPDC006339]|uniref:cupin domain-containing protein n=1 Tax=Streptomyces sp. NPDC006339 TaxID=3156755 RepID=UPI0033B41FB9